MTMGHCKTIFLHILKLIPEPDFGKVETKHRSGRKARSFSIPALH